MMPSDELSVQQEQRGSVTTFSCVASQRRVSHLGHPSALKCPDCSKNIGNKYMLLIPGVVNSLCSCEK